MEHPRRHRIADVNVINRVLEKANSSLRVKAGEVATLEHKKEVERCLAIVRGKP